MLFYNFFYKRIMRAAQYNGLGIDVRQKRTYFFGLDVKNITFYVRGKLAARHYPCPPHAIAQSKLLYRIAFRRRRCCKHSATARRRSGLYCGLYANDRKAVLPP